MYFIVISIKREGLAKKCYWMLFTILFNSWERTVQVIKSELLALIQNEAIVSDETDTDAEVIVIFKILNAVC